MIPLENAVFHRLEDPVQQIRVYVRVCLKLFLVAVDSPRQSPPVLLKLRFKYLDCVLDSFYGLGHEVEAATGWLENEA